MMMIYKYRSERETIGRAGALISRGGIRECERPFLFAEHFFAHFRSLLIARPLCQKRNGKLTRNGCATKRRALARRAWFIRLARRIDLSRMRSAMITRVRERPVRFSEPSIAFVSYFTHPRMVNFVQSWQRVSADRPIAAGRPSRAFK